MNKCRNYYIPCPWALSDNAPMPCFGTQEQCDMWREKYKTEAPEEYQKALEDKARLEGIRILEK